MFAYAHASPNLKLLLIMGSHGDTWLLCEWCRKGGQCLIDLPADVTPLTDIDGIGVLCDHCCNRGWPPHFDYLERLFQFKFQVQQAELSQRIARFAYAVCVDH